MRGVESRIAANALLISRGDGIFQSTGGQTRKQEPIMSEMPSQEQIDDIMRRAHYERARAMRDGLNWISRQMAAPFRQFAQRPTERRS